MSDRRRLIHSTCLLLAPIMVAVLGLSSAAAVALVVLLLIWRWLVVMIGLTVPEKSPELVLETISISHYVEKVRWCMDRLGLEYTEVPAAGTLGAFYRGRTVPRLTVRTGAVRSTIGNSAEILRYLWGRYGYTEPAVAAFLEPTEARIELEEQLDRYGRNLQLWVYYRLFGCRDLLLHAWGANNPALPGWQRALLHILYPLQARLIRRAFSINDESFARAVVRIEAFLGDMDNQLSDGRKSLLGGDELNYSDFAFAAMTGAWFMPPGYGGGKAEAVRLERDRIPEPMRMDIEGWVAAYPHVARYVTDLYRDERLR